MSDVEKKLESFYFKKCVWVINGWDIVIKEIYDDVISGYLRRNYDIKFVVELVRFIWNLYVYVYNFLFESNKEFLLEKFVFLKCFLFLVIEMYKVVKVFEEWKIWRDLSYFFRWKRDLFRSVDLFMSWVIKLSWDFFLCWNYVFLIVKDCGKVCKKWSYY